MQHRFTTIAKARSFNRCHFHDAAHVVDNQSRQRFAFHIFSHDQQWTRGFRYAFQYWQQFADVRDFLIHQQDEWVIQFYTA
ncbi:Uncharacterised protein [Vibrio cholerae]|nr:Uncharacterised protein [Vibrio cholerae]CSB43765.1 Uncharacterised protein [Vibrio cholerae]CSB91076.1 Uncharacterised protein [Vibrio cholerae]CSC67059.1 Uncharacterised protein [Vibrio cholerae]CSD02409.1 Uncharacterised protein [Vibrio cholerae]